MRTTVLSFVSLFFCATSGYAEDTAFYWPFDQVEDGAYVAAAPIAGYADPEVIDALGDTPFFGWLVKTMAIGRLKPSAI